jgi:hypothetical protein
MQNIYDLEKHTLQGIDVYFDENGHKYYIDSEEVMGVTNSSGMTKDTGFLAPWGAKAAATEADKIFKQKKVDELKRLQYFDRIKSAFRKQQKKGMDYGNVAHEFLRQWGQWKIGKGEVMPSTLKKPELVSREIKRTVKPFIDWSVDNKIIWTAAEQVVLYQGEGFRYCGTIDIRFEINGLHAIGDYKTGTRVGVNDAWQMAMYAMAVEQCFDVRVDRLYLFHLPKKGGRKSMKVIPFSRDMFRWEYSMYLAAIKAQEFRIKQAMK